MIISHPEQGLLTKCHMPDACCFLVNAPRVVLTLLSVCFWSRCWGRTTRMWQSSWTTWPFCVKTRASMRRWSITTWERWRSTRPNWVLTTPTWQRPRTTWWEGQRRGGSSITLMEECSFCQLGYFNIAITKIQFRWNQEWSDYLVCLPCAKVYHTVHFINMA